MDILKKIFQQTSWQVLGKAVSSLSTILILGLVSRNFGTTGTGIYTLVLTYLSFFYLAADLGINAYILPHLLKENSTHTFQKLLGLRITLSLVLMLLSALIVLLWPVDLSFRQAALFGLPAILGAGIFATSSALFQSKLRFDLQVLSSSFGAIITLFIVWLITISSTDTSKLLAGQSLGLLTGGVLSLVLIRNYTKLLPIFNFSYIKQVLLESWPISATLLLNIVYFRLDAFILTAVKSYSEVGIYNVSYQIFQSLLVVPAYIMNSFYPMMLKDFSEDFAKFKTNFKKAMLLMFGIGLVGTLLTLLLSPQVIDIVTGSKGFADSASSLRILSLGFPGFFVTSVLMWALITFKKYKTMLVIYIVGLIFNTALNLILIPQYSYFAASAVTVASEYLILGLQIVVLVPILSKKSITRGTSTTRT